MFNSYPTYPPYRTLRISNPLMRGEDVYALQTGLKAIGADPGLFDGILGNNTASAIRKAQQTLKVVVDGLAGGDTQTALSRHLADKARTQHSLPPGLVFGQLMHESGCRVGNYSPKRSDGNYDAGVAQRNTSFTPAKEGFTVPLSISHLGSHLRRYYDKYVGVISERRRWELAAGSWNAPAFANWIARDEGAQAVPASDTLKPGATARATLEQYMDSATAYMVI